MGGRQREERTIHWRKRDIDHFAAFPLLEVTNLVLIKREVWKYHRFRNLGFNVASKAGAGDHTRMQCIVNPTRYPESSLYKTNKIQAGDDPTVLPRHGVHPGYVMGG